jgi:hypothetical protein
MSRAIQDATACREALSRLPQLDLGELRQEWRALYKAEASPHLSGELLVRAVACRPVTPPAASDTSQLSGGVMTAGWIISARS